MDSPALRTSPCLHVTSGQRQKQRNGRLKITNIRDLTLYGDIKTAQQRTIIQQYGDYCTGRWWAGCYIWHSEEGPGRAAAPPSPLLAVPNVTAHP